eukprot:g46691.t1
MSRQPDPAARLAKSKAAGPPVYTHVKLLVVGDSGTCLVAADRSRAARRAQESRRIAGSGQKAQFYPTPACFLAAPRRAPKPARCWLDSGSQAGASPAAPASQCARNLAQTELRRLDVPHEQGFLCREAQGVRLSGALQPGRPRGQAGPLNAGLRKVPGDGWVRAAPRALQGVAPQGCAASPGAGPGRRTPADTKAGLNKPHPLDQGRLMMCS